MTYNEKLPSINLRDPFITWTCEIMLQIEKVTSSLSQILWPSNLAEWSFRGGTPTHQVIWSSDHVVMWGHVTNRKYHSSVSKRPKAAKTLQGLDLLWGTPTDEATRLFDHINVWYHSLKQKYSISTLSVLSLKCWCCKLIERYKVWNSQKIIC